MSQALSQERTLELARQVLRVETRALQALEARLDQRFFTAVQLILQRHGRVIVSGIGKSGHIARKIAATMASTGTPAYFVHAAEAMHGDLGMITGDDVLIALSYSGENVELLAILPSVRRLGGKVIAITGNPNSALAREADIHLDAAVTEEACPLNLAPTASTTTALALGDALAVALLDARGFGADDFARSHPGGSLGRKLLTHVSDVMRGADEVPVVAESALIPEALVAMSRGRLGMTAITTAQGALCGIFTDGDLRRALERLGDLRQIPVRDVMGHAPAIIAPGKLAVEAVEIMETRKISQLLVVDKGQLVGALNMHDLLQAKVV
jgi:arabinose-5-phosphate isomerase